MLVSIIVPAYKKEDTIRQDVTNIVSTMEQTRWQFEVIVVVDGFLDKTFEEAEKINKPNVKIVGYPTNRGKGYAIRYGMARAHGDYVAFIDAGMEINANGISMILEHMIWYEADAIIASKRHQASKVSSHWLRKIYSFFFHLLVRIMFRLKVKDTQTGLKVYKRKVIEDVLPRLLIKEYAFDVELLAVANHLGYTRIYEAPVEVSLDFGAGSRFNKLLFLNPLIRNMMWDTLAVFYRLYIVRYYDNDNSRKWIYDKELDMKINTGASERLP